MNKLIGSDVGTLAALIEIRNYLSGASKNMHLVKNTVRADVNAKISEFDKVILKMSLILDVNNILLTQTLEKDSSSINNKNSKMLTDAPKPKKIVKKSAKRPKNSKKKIGPDLSSVEDEKLLNKRIKEEKKKLASKKSTKNV